MNSCGDVRASYIFFKLITINKLIQIESGNVFIGVRYRNIPGSFGLIVGEFLLINN